MKYAKLINNHISYAPNPIKHAGLWCGNPPGEIYEAERYKPVRYTEPPTEPGEGYQWSETWSETEDAILQGWEQVLVPISEEEALTRYANELTGNEDETLTEATETLIKQLKEDK